MKSSVHVYIHKIYRYYVYVLHMLHVHTSTDILFILHTFYDTLNTTRLVNKHIYLYLYNLSEVKRKIGHLYRTCTWYM